MRGGKPFWAGQLQQLQQQQLEQDNKLVHPWGATFSGASVRILCPPSRNAVTRPLRGFFSLPLSSIFSLPRWLTHPSLHGSHYTSQPPDMDFLLLLLMIRYLHSIGLFTKSLKLLLHLRIHSNYCTNPSSRPPLKSLRLFVFSAGFRTNPSLPTEISQFGSFCVQSLDLSSIYIPRSRPKHTRTRTHKERSSLRLPPTNRSPKSKIKRYRAPNAGFRSSLRSSTTTRNDCQGQRAWC